MDRWSVIMAAVCMCAIGALFYNILPLIMGVAEDDLGLDLGQVGGMSSVFFAGFTLTTITAFFWIRRCNWRRTGVMSLLLSVLALTAAGLSENQTGLLIWMFLSGCTLSILYGIGTTAIGDTSVPARWFGLKMSAEAALGAFLLWVLPGTLVVSHGFAGLMGGMAVLVLLLLPLVLIIPPSGSPRNSVTDSEDAATPVAGIKPALWLALLGAALFMFAATLVWAFVERIAAESGYEPVAVGRVLSLTLLFAVAGSMTAMALGNRKGSASPLAVACLALVAGIAWLWLSDSLFSWAGSVCLMTWASALGITYAVTAVAQLDLDGRFVVLTVPALGLGVMAAPVGGGLLVMTGGFTLVFSTAMVMVTLSLTCSLIALRRGLPIVHQGAYQIGDC